MSGLKWQGEARDIGRGKAMGGLKGHARARVGVGKQLVESPLSKEETSLV